MNKLNDHPTFGIACFCEDFRSVRMWNEYSGMDGVCLEFNFDGYASMIKENKNLRILKVNYSEKLYKRNFFKTLRDNTEADQEYFQDIVNSIITKLKDYDNEKEKRIIAINGANQKYKYNFSDLKSITFAPKINIDQKKKIIEIIYEKCKQENRKDFIFYQAELRDGYITRYKNYSYDLMCD